MEFSPEMIEAASQQAFLYGLLTLLVIVLSLSSHIALLIKGFKDESEFLRGFAAVLFFVVVFFSFYCFADSICAIAHPEYYALKNLMGMMVK